MKLCGTCKKEKPLDEFYQNRTKRDGLSSYCRDCKREYNKSHYKEHGHLWKETRAQSRDMTRKQAQDFICEYLIDHPCIDCGETDILVLEFDHLYDKKFNIAEKMSSRIDILKQEIEKCEVVCANCHKRRTSNRIGGNYRAAFLTQRKGNHACSRVYS